jgi:NTE family protein
LEEISFLSTVSGGSLCVGLVYALNEFRWPESQVFLDQILPKARQLLTTRDLQRSMIWRALRSPWSIFDTRADDLSALIRKHWGITIQLDELPEQPRWMINATCCETGKNWRFERFRMGDYLFGYTYDTHIPLSDAIAASAGFPGLIGPLVFKPEGRNWFRYRDRATTRKALSDPAEQMEKKTESIQPAFSPLHLWDGGVYDNHGLEGLHDFVKGWREDVEFFIVSDGAGRGRPEAYRQGSKALMRIATGILMDQVRSLRARAIVERLINHNDPGAFLQIGNTCSSVLHNAGRGEETLNICPDCVSDEEADQAARMPTVIRRLSPEEYELLLRHGYEVADCTLYGYYPEEFPYRGYGNRKEEGVVEQAEQT